MSRRRGALLLMLPILLAVALVLIFQGDRVTEAILDTASNPPWEAQPTRISTQLTPFADIPGFTQPTPIPTRTT